MSFHHLDCGQSIEGGYLGPSLELGPLPALFYFSLSAQDSLCLDPFNQPAAYLSGLPLRIFSLTLPGHENGLPPTDALNVWAREMQMGTNLIDLFVEQVRIVVNDLFLKRVLIEDKIGVAGLSRGAFLATHAAAHIPAFRYILGFSPLSQLKYAKEFAANTDLPLVQSASLEHLAPLLTDRKLRYYIGNLDTRVGTRSCFDFIEKLAQTALANKIRSPQTELILFPSIGHQGHGTPKEIFHHGAQWIAEQLGAIDVM